LPDSVLLRVRDLDPELNTIEEHSKIAAARGVVSWGWWKKPLEPMPDPGLTVIKRELEDKVRELEAEGVSTLANRMPWIYFINSADRGLYRARLLGVHYKPGGGLSKAPTAGEAVPPAYYAERELPAWFTVTDFEKLQTGYLERFVWSRENRTTPIQSYTALPERAIGKGALEDLGKGFDFLDSNVSLWFITPTHEIGLLKRSDFVESLSRTVWPAKGRYAIHLSDLHFGLGHGYRNQLASEAGSRTGRETLLEAILRDLRALRINETQIAIVLVTGDLTWRGDAHEFSNAQSFFESLGDELGLHASQIVIVPGNHDIEWRDDKGDIDENANHNFHQFSKNMYVSTPDDTFLRIHRFDIAGRIVSVIGLNSCRIEKKDTAGLGYVGRDQLDKALRFLFDLYPPNGQCPKDELRIALVHHHLMPVNFVEDIDWSEKRVSIMLDAEGVLRSLLFAKVRMVMHGHQHQPFASDVRRIVPGYVDPFAGKEHNLDDRIAIIGGGSIGVERKHLNVVGRNTYNIVDLAAGDNQIVVQTRLQSPVGPGFVDYYGPITFDV
jgi:3',5'-cyclic AMP phosphodiesterase CpdA